MNCDKCPDKDWCSSEEMDKFICPVFDYNYQSPIELIAGEIQTKIDNDSVKIVQNYGFNVDKVELEKALKYDRQQYDKGYLDARKRYERPQGEWIHSKDGCLCSNCDRPVAYDDCGDRFLSDYCPWCGADMRGEEDE